MTSDDSDEKLVFAALQRARRLQHLKDATPKCSLAHAETAAWLDDLADNGMWSTLTKVARDGGKVPELQLFSGTQLVFYPKTPEAVIDGESTSATLQADDRAFLLSTKPCTIVFGCADGTRVQVTRISRTKTGAGSWKAISVTKPPSGRSIGKRRRGSGPRLGEPSS
ncbi:hypothetical protein KBD87_03165 [Candidatus Saccharibacteria bacterium]|nr:hypothetical protein [Candidatus Saccharibacteria bacterium]